ncbi:MAG: ParB N-terminal domain-containing protein [Polyangiaceae bacterium]|nr:ParB N-terminal domain-containing protein [Polyangiaceae bacterium]
MATKKTATPKKTATAAKGTKRRRGVKLQPTTLSAPELVLATPPEDLAPLCDRIAADGGAVIGAYREPLGGHPLLFASLPIDRVHPTSFQRDASDAHVRKLTVAMDKTRRFLDPVIAVADDAGYMVPNGNHRLTALKELGAKAVVALVVPDVKVAYQILALNIEKAHNLRERAIEVVRMYRDLARFDDRKESDCALEFEEPLLVTLGFAYEKRPRLSGGAYGPVLKKVDHWIEKPLASAAEERERRSALVLELDDAVAEAVEKLKARGLVSPYLKAFVVARINPLRFIKGEPPPLEELLPSMAKRARGMKTEGVKVEDLARSGGAPEEE